MSLFFRLRRVPTTDLPTAGTRNTGSLIYDTTTSTVKFSDGSSWANVAGAAANHAILSSSHSDATAGTCTRGDIITGQGATPTWTRLAKGTQYTFLTMGANEPAWSSSTLTLAGNLTTSGAYAVTLTATNTTTVTLPTTGTLAVNPMTGVGDMIRGGTAGAETRLAVGTAAQVLLCNATPIPAWTTLSGDVTVGATGTTAIGSGVIVNDDINATAGITTGKIALATGSIIIGASSVGSALDVKGDGKIIVGNGTTATSVSVSGDATLANDGALTVTKLTIASATAGDVLYYNGTGWTRLAKPSSGTKYLQGGTTPSWTAVSAGIASDLSNSVTINNTTNDATLTSTDQTAAGESIVIPDFNAGGTTHTLAFLNVAQAFSAVQTFTNTGLHILDTNASHDLILAPGSDLTADHTLTITTGDADRTLSLGGNLTTLGAWTQTGAFTLGLTLSNNTSVTLPTTGTLATVDGALGNCTVTTVNKLTLTQPANGSTITITDAKTFSVSNTLTLAGTDGQTFTFPATSDTVACLGTAQAFSQVQTFLNNGIHILDSNASHDLVLVAGSDITADRNFTITTGDAARTLTMSGDINVSANFSTVHGDALTLTTTAATDVTLPTTGTLVAQASTDTLTNKTLDANGTGNVISNIDAAELYPITVNTNYAGVSFKIYGTVTNTATTTVYNANAPFKFRVLDAYVYSTSADVGGTVTVQDGDGHAISSAMTTTGDTNLIRTTLIDDAHSEIPQNGGLKVVSSNGTDDFGFVITCIRVV